MSTLIICLILLVIIALAVKSIIHRIKHGSACCGERDAAPKKIIINDKNKSHYPFEYIMKIDGMHCSNCVRFVENALNSEKELWATVNLEKKKPESWQKVRWRKNFLKKLFWMQAILHFRLKQ